MLNARRSRLTGHVPTASEVIIVGYGRPDYKGLEEKINAGLEHLIPIPPVQIGTGGGGSLVSASYLVADGYWGKSTTRALQKRFGTPTDGEIWQQYLPHKAKNPGLTSGWKWVDSTKLAGSPLIKKMQSWLGVTADGVAGPGTFAALQRRLGKVADGVLWGPSPAIAEMQRRLNAGTL